MENTGNAHALSCYNDFEDLQELLYLASSQTPVEQIPPRTLVQMIERAQVFFAQIRSKDTFTNENNARELIGDCLVTLRSLADDILVASYKHNERELLDSLYSLGGCVAISEPYYGMQLLEEVIDPPYREVEEQLAGLLALFSLKV